MCIESGDKIDLDRLKVYRVIPDADALKCGMLRLIDASGEDYVYPADWFVPLNLTPIARSVLIDRRIELVPAPKRIARIPK